MSYEHRLVEANQGKNEHLDKIGREVDAEIAKLKAENERLSERLAFEMRRGDALSTAQADLINRQTELKAHNAALLAVVKAATGICAKVFISSQEDYDALFVALNAARAAGAME